MEMCDSLPGGRSPISSQTSVWRVCAPHFFLNPAVEVYKNMSLLSFVSLGVVCVCDFFVSYTFIGIRVVTCQPSVILQIHVI